MISATRGYKVHFISSVAFANEKLRTMKAFGAELEIIPSDNEKITAKLIDAIIERAKELSNEPNTFGTDQINNNDNKIAYHNMAKEIIDDLGNDIDEFITGVGTGTSFSENAEILKNEIPGIRCTAIEPKNVRFLSGGDTSETHGLEGIGLGFIPSIYRKDLQDDVISVSDEDAYEPARKLAKLEGIWGEQLPALMFGLR